jgi:hypothetical protein
MASKLLVLHGYSDGATSFTDLAEYFVQEGLYKREDVYLLNYASMDDHSIFEDFADKLDEDYDKLFKGERIDIACHSTGALVVRLWLVLHYRRQKQAGTKPRSPVEHLLMFAPANFGSDLAKMGQSFLGKFRSTFFNANVRKGDFLESGKYVLQGLEPASPFQWTLSAEDLHGEGFFNPALGEKNVCFPYVFAAGRGYTGIQARVIEARRKPGTDGTVRICGTSLNTRKCVVDFCNREVNPVWVPEQKFQDIPFAIFGEHNHGSIITKSAGFGNGRNSPGGFAKAALAVQSIAEYDTFARRCASYTTQHYEEDPYQQFFFRVIDDVGLAIDDYYIDFHVLRADGRVHDKLTLEFDKQFEQEFYRHSKDGSCRALLVNLAKFRAFGKRLRQEKAKLVFDVVATSPVKEVKYLPAFATLLGGTDNNDEPSFFYPNTTTLVEIILNRVATDKVLELLDIDLKALKLEATTAATSRTGRALLFTPRPPTPADIKPGA